MHPAGYPHRGSLLPLRSVALPSAGPPHLHSSQLVLPFSDRERSGALAHLSNPNCVASLWQLLIPVSFIKPGCRAGARMRFPLLASFNALLPRLLFRQICNLGKVMEMAGMLAAQQAAQRAAGAQGVAEMLLQKGQVDSCAIRLPPALWLDQLVRTLTTGAPPPRHH